MEILSAKYSLPVEKDYKLRFISCRTLENSDELYSEKSCNSITVPKIGLHVKS